MNKRVALSSEGISEALNLVDAHIRQTEVSDIPDLGDAVLKLMTYLIQAIFQAIDPYDEPEMASEIEQFETDTLDKVIALIQSVSESPELKPLLLQGRIHDVTFLEGDMVLFELESHSHGNARTISTLKAGFF